MGSLPHIQDRPSLAKDGTVSLPLIAEILKFLVSKRWGKKQSYRKVNDGAVEGWLSIPLFGKNPCLVPDNFMWDKLMFTGETLWLSPFFPHTWFIQNINTKSRKNTLPNCRHACKTTKAYILEYFSASMIRTCGIEIRRWISYPAKI